MSRVQLSSEAFDQPGTEATPARASAAVDSAPVVGDDELEIASGTASDQHPP